MAQRDIPFTDTYYPVCLSNLEILADPNEGGRGKPGNESQDMQFLTEFMRSRKESDRLISVGQQAASIADLGVSRVVGPHAPIYAFGKIVLGQQLDAFRRQTEQIERELVGSILRHGSFDKDKLLAAKLLGPDAYSTMFRKQAGLSEEIWDGLRQDERDDALLSVSQKLMSATIANSSRISRLQLSQGALFQAYARMQRQMNTIEKGVGRVAKNTDSTLRIVKSILAKHARAEAVAKITNDFLVGRTTGQEFATRMESLGVKSEDVKALRDLKSRDAFESSLADLVYASQIINRVSPDSDLARFSRTVAMAANLTLAFVSRAARHDYFGAVASFLDMTASVSQDSQTSKMLDQILNEIRDLRSELRQIHLDLSNRLETLYELDTAILAALKAAQRADLIQCTNFLDYRTKYGFQSSTNQFQSYSAMQRHFTDKEKSYSICRKHLNTLLSLESTFFGYFGASQTTADAVMSGRLSLGQSFDKWLRPYLYLSRDFANDRDLQVGSFLLPSLEFETLERKTAQMKSTEGSLRLTTIRPHYSELFREKSEDTRMRFYYENFFKLISVKALTEYVSLELEVNRYADIVKKQGAGSTLIEARDIPNVETAGFEGRHRLLLVLDLVELAMAQQSWLGGDAMLAELANEAWRPFELDKAQLDFYRENRDPQPRERENAANRTALSKMAIAANPLLLQNVLRHRVYSNMRKGRLNSFAFAWARSMKHDPYFVNYFLGDGIQAVWKEEPTGSSEQKLESNWYFTFSFKHPTERDQGGEPKEIAVRLVPLPPVEDVRNRTFAVSPEMTQLLNLRERVKAHILDYEVVEYARKRRSIGSLNRIALRQAALRRLKK